MSAPRELPILFTGEMVRAILELRKTVTRRVVNPQPNAGPLGQMVHLGDGDWAVSDEDLWGLWPCPYGQPGDRLYVRETWRALHRFESRRPSEIPEGSYVWYDADGGEDLQRRPGRLDRFGKRRPSIFMPKWAARIWLEVTSVRVERVQEITTADVFAEGVQIPVTPEGRPLLRFSFDSDTPPAAAYLPKGRLGPRSQPLSTDEWARIYFAELWDSINGKRAPWFENRWVWVVSFRLLDEVTS